MNDVSWFGPDYTPKIPQSPFLSTQNISRAPTKLTLIAITVSKEEVTTEKKWTFDLRV